MILKKVISGGQTGVDQAALRAAKAAGIATGGQMPLGWRTLSGPRPEFEELYGMTESTSPDYAPRTSANVRESDATLRIAVDFASAGERCTLSAITRHGKPYLDVSILYDVSDLGFRGRSVPSLDPQGVARWIVAREIAVLNVAGNSEVTAPGIGAIAERYLSDLLADLREVR